MTYGEGALQPCFPNLRLTHCSRQGMPEVDYEGDDPEPTIFMDAEAEPKEAEPEPSAAAPEAAPAEEPTAALEEAKEAQNEDPTTASHEVGIAKEVVPETAPQEVRKAMGGEPDPGAAHGPAAAATADTDMAEAAPSAATDEEVKPQETIIGDAAVTGATVSLVEDGKPEVSTAAADADAAVSATKSPV